MRKTSSLRRCGNNRPAVDCISSLFVNDPLIIPWHTWHTGTNNFQFFGANGQSWSMAVNGPASGPVQITGTGV